MRVGRTHDQRAKPAKLLMQEAYGIGSAVIGSEGIGTDEFGERVGVMGGGRAQRAHLVNHRRNAAGRDLPRRLAAGEAAADDVNCCRASHSGLARRCRGKGQSRHENAPNGGGVIRCGD